MHERGYTPKEIEDFWGGRTRTIVYRVLHKNGLSPNQKSITKLCKINCVGNDLIKGEKYNTRMRFISSYKYCPYCGDKLHYTKPSRILKDAHGETI